jgi:hypothetical protein
MNIEFTREQLLVIAKVLTDGFGHSTDPMPFIEALDTIFKNTDITSAEINEVRL